MNKKTILSLFVIWMMSLSSNGQTGNVFEQYFNKALQFSKMFPKEKVHLHLDNSSYYQGDTIWFKAYVVTASDNLPSKISKPLYVEVLDQLGNVMERHIVKLNNGEGSGQIPLTNALFTGYYEIRAYTRWMLAFDDPQYFSVTVPIYRKRLNPDESSRNIASYRMDKSMKQRPNAKMKELEARFYPEGGHLIKGLTSVVGLETVSRDSGALNLNGFLLSPTGERLMPISTIHDGMGTFFYTPGESHSKIELLYKGKSYRFDLPESDNDGYTLMVNNRDDSFDVLVSRSSEDLNDSLALFTFSQGVPFHYIPVSFVGNTSKHIRFMKNDLPGGVLRMSLINSVGKVICDRFCFSSPTESVHLEGNSDQKIYHPFSKANYKLRLTDQQGNPLPNKSVSISIRDGLETDYQQGDQSIYTDLLLTSDLKGYIHQPGFYFEKNNSLRRKLLDNLLLIRDWRKYDLDIALGKKSFVPKQIPEPNLTIYGAVASWFGKPQSNIGVSVLANSDSVFISGTVHADSLGNFSFPIDDFYGNLESLIQTKRDGKQFNRNTTVSLFRTFEPELRALDVAELNPKWESPVDTGRVGILIDSLISVKFEKDAKLLGEVVVKGEKRYNSLKQTESFERDIVAFYNIRQYVDKERDKGDFVANDVGYLLHKINPMINVDGTEYGVNELKYSANGMEIQQSFIQKDVDMIETAMLYIDRSGRFAYKLGDSYRVEVSDLNDIFTNTRADTISLVDMKNIIIRCAFKMADNWNVDKSYTPTHGIRKTVIQGYDKPKEFYSPIYPDSAYFEPQKDLRRTLYWNPELKTDEKGEAIVHYFNGRKTTYMNVHVETLVDGKPAAITTFSYPQRDQ